MKGCTYYGKNLELGLLPGRELVPWHLQTIRLNAQASWERPCGSHPNVWMGRVLDLRPHSETLQLPGKDVEHRLPRDKRGSPEGDDQLVTRPVVVATNLARSNGDFDRIQRGGLGRGELVQRCVDVPAVEPGDAARLVLGGDTRLVESSVGGVFELGDGEPLVIVDDAVADELDLRHAGDGL